MKPTPAGLTPEDIASWHRTEDLTKAQMSWSRRFREPIKTPDGKTLRTLQHAAKYVLALPPKAEGSRPVTFPS